MPGFASNAVLGGARIRPGKTLGGGAFAVPVPFDPRSLTGLALWLDARHVLGFNSVPADAAAVSSWTDLSVNGRTATQGTGLNQPLFRSAGLNSKASVDFDGVDHYLATAAVAISQPFTVYVVAKADVTTGTQMILGNGGSGTGVCRSAAGSMGSFCGAVLGAHATGTTAHVYSFVGNSTSSVMAMDGVETAGDAGTDSWVTETIIVGSYSTGSNRWNGHISAVLIYNGLHTAGTRTQVTRYLGAQFAVTVP